MHDKTILVIDDNPFILHLVRDILRKSGYQTLVSGTGMGGIKLALDKQPDLIILDRKLRDVSGHHVLEAIKQDKRARDIPVTMLSSVNTRQEILRSWTLGANDYIVKPFKIHTLLDKVHRLVGASGRDERYYFI